MGRPDRVLVAYGTKHGATAEIAEAIGTALRVAGLETKRRRLALATARRRQACCLSSLARARGNGVRLLATPGVATVWSGPRWLPRLSPKEKNPCELPMCSYTILGNSRHGNVNR